MIDAIIEIVAGVFVGNARKMNDGVALVEQRLPVECPREIRKRNRGDVWMLEVVGRSRRGDHAVSQRDKVRNQMTSDEPVGAGHERLVFLLPRLAGKSDRAPGCALSSLHIGRGREFIDPVTPFRRWASCI